jgi:hypothetical protein
MRKRTGGALFLGLTLLLSGLAFGQEPATRVEIRKGEVVYVSPGFVVVRGKNGLQKFTRADWKNYEVIKDGQKITPDQLQVGDIVTATFITSVNPTAPSADEIKSYGIAVDTSKTVGDVTSERVVWTEIKQGQVVYVSPAVLLIKGKNGVQKFTRADWKDTRVEKEGKMIDPSELHTGDIVTATFITRSMPGTITEQQAASYTEAPAPPPAHAHSKPAASEASKAPAPSSKPAPMAMASNETKPKAKTLPKTATSLPMLGLTGLVLLGLGLTLTGVRRRTRTG